MMQKRCYMKPVLLKFGAALAITLGGILYSYLRRNKFKHCKPLPPPSQPSLDTGQQTDSGGARNDNHFTCNSSSVGPEKHEDSHVFRSPTRSCSNDKSSPRARLNGGKDELQSLRNTVTILKERERDLEVRLLELYGLKEQETALMELENRLEINNMESKLFKLKIESLEADNKRLQAHICDQAKVSTELEDAKAKIKILKRTMRYEGEQNKKQILALREKLKKLQEHEKEDVAANQAAIQEKLRSIQILKREAEELKKSNDTLKLENSELTQKVDYVHLIATTVLDDDEKSSVFELKRLKHENEELLKEIERLQADHSSDTEELVYLRWLNACLQHQLRHQQPTSTSPREQVGRELNTTLGSELDEKSNSCVTDSGEDISSVDLSSSHNTHGHIKTTVMNKFKRLLRGKRRNSHIRRSVSGDTSAYIEDMMGGFPSYSPARHSGFSPVTDNVPDGIYDSSRSSSHCSRLSS